MENINSKNCNNCKFGTFGGVLGKCEALKNNKEYQAIWENRDCSSMERWNKTNKFKANFVCKNFEYLYIQYPIEVSKINTENFTNKSHSYQNSEIGKFVKIAPCAEEYKGKTYLGLYLGELPIGPHITHNSDTKELCISTTKNPAIFVFDLNKIVYGMESFWEIIECEEQLKEITNEDIQNIWYMKALKGLK